METVAAIEKMSASLLEQLREVENAVSGVESACDTTYKPDPPPVYTYEEFFQRYQLAKLAQRTDRGHRNAFLQAYAQILFMNIGQLELEFEGCLDPDMIVIPSPQHYENIKKYTVFNAFVNRCVIGRESQPNEYLLNKKPRRQLEREVEDLKYQLTHIHDIPDSLSELRAYISTTKSRLEEANALEPKVVERCVRLMARAAAKEAGH